MTSARLTPARQAWLQHLSDHGPSLRFGRHGPACNDCTLLGWTEYLPGSLHERLTDLGRLRLSTPPEQGVPFFRSTRTQVPA
jgi:hypothetical protein